MFHTENHINSMAEHLQSLLKLLSMFKISILYYDTTVENNVPYDVGIMCISCWKMFGC